MPASCAGLRGRPWGRLPQRALPMRGTDSGLWLVPSCSLCVSTRPFATGDDRGRRLPWDPLAVLTQEATPGVSRPAQSGLGHSSGDDDSCLLTTQPSLCPLCRDSAGSDAQVGSSAARGELQADRTGAGTCRGALRLRPSLEQDTRRGGGGGPFCCGQSPAWVAWSPGGVFGPHGNRCLRLNQHAGECRAETRRTWRLR